MTAVLTFTATDTTTVAVWLNVMHWAAAIPIAGPILIWLKRSSPSSG